jgi:hypothetical protein
MVSETSLIPFCLLDYFLYPPALRDEPIKYDAINEKIEDKKTRHI